MKKYLWLLAACSLAAGATLSCTSDSDTECLAEEVKCENGMLFTCTVDEAWPAQGTACASGTCENAIKCQDPVISCTAGEKVCKDNVHQECNAAGDAWSMVDCSTSNTYCDTAKACVECLVVDHCPSGSLDCVDNKCVADNVVCTNGTSKCLDNELVTCVDGVWGDGVLCGDQGECKDGNDQCTTIEVVSCTNDDTKCEDNKLVTCVDEAWGTGVACDAGQECKDGNDQCTAIEVVSCTNDDTKCEDNKLVTCVDEVWGDGVACGIDHECKDGNDQCTAIEVISCTNGNTKCEDNKLVTCVDEVWGTGVACETGLVCIDGETSCTTPAAMQCAFTVLEDSPETASVTGKVLITKGYKIIGGGVACSQDLTIATASWKLSSSTDLPKQNTAYTGSGADEWQSGTVTGLAHGLTYCTYIVRLEDESRHVCPISATLGTAKVSDNALILTEAETRLTTITCGNNTINVNEECDGTNVGTNVCKPGTTGTVTCTSECKLSYVGCLDSSIDLKHSEDFTEFKASTSYSNTENIGDVSIVGAMYNATNIIDGNTLVIGDKADGSVTINNLAAGLGTLTFQYKSWVSDSFDPAKHKLEIFVNDESTPSGELILSGNYGSPVTAVITVNKIANSFSIKKAGNSSGNPPRILIDNIKWSDNK